MKRIELIQHSIDFQATGVEVGVMAFASYLRAKVGRLKMLKTGITLGSLSDVLDRPLASSARDKLVGDPYPEEEEGLRT